MPQEGELSKAQEDARNDETDSATEANHVAAGAEDERIVQTTGPLRTGPESVDCEPAKSPVISQGGSQVATPRLVAVRSGSLSERPNALGRKLLAATTTAEVISILEEVRVNNRDRRHREAGAANCVSASAEDQRTVEAPVPSKTGIERAACVPVKPPDAGNTGSDACAPQTMAPRSGPSSERPNALGRKLIAATMTAEVIAILEEVRVKNRARRNRETGAADYVAVSAENHRIVKATVPLKTGFDGVDCGPVIIPHATAERGSEAFIPKALTACSPHARIPLVTNL